MIPRILIKHPIFFAGLLIFFIGISDMIKKKKFPFDVEKLSTTSCKGAIVKLKRKAGPLWNIFCEGNNIAVEIPLNSQIDDVKSIRPLAYREMANHLTFIAKNSAADSLERVLIVRVRLESKNFVFNGVTNGKDIVKLATMKKPAFIAKHLQSTVQVKEQAK